MSDSAGTFSLRRLHIVHHAVGGFGVTKVVDAETGDEVRNWTSLEVFQTSPSNPMFAVIKLVAVVERFSGEVQASEEPGANDEADRRQE